MKLIPSDCFVNVTRAHYLVSYRKILVLFLAVTGHSLKTEDFYLRIKEMGSSSSFRHKCVHSFLLRQL